MTKLLKYGQKTDRKANILEATNGGLDIFRYFIPEFKEEGKVFSSPFRSDKKPSANIFQATSGHYLYKDFAGDNPLNAFDFVGKKTSQTDFTEIMNTIEKEVLHINKQANPLGKPAHKPIFKIADTGDSTYWLDYINDAPRLNQFLEKYHIHVLDSYHTNANKLINQTPDNPIFSFKISDGCYKIYQPLQTVFKHQWIGEKPPGFKNIWGIDQLPPTCETILITEGNKDCFVSNANLNHLGIYAVGLDNASTQLDVESIQELRKRSDHVLLCLDIDAAGIKASASKSKKYGLKEMRLPAILADNQGKDISDWFKLELNNDLLISAINKVKIQPDILPELPVANQSLLQKLLSIESTLTETASKEIVKTPSVVEYAGFPIFKQGTLNILQGQFGSHKSRLAQGFCSLLLSTAQNPTFAGYKRTMNDFVVCYIDTERNAKEEFPMAIKGIVKEAGLTLKKNSPFRFTSIKTVPRTKRLDAVKQFLESICKNQDKPVFAVLDVGTDCVVNFNDPEESMLLIDFIGNLSEEFNTTFLLVVHENPNSKKARGHLGSEGVNKGSTVISISVVSDKLIKLEYIKQRATKHFEPLFLTYDETANRLIKASQDLVNAADDAAKPKASVEKVIIELGKIMTEPTEFMQKDLLHTLTQTFHCSDNTIKQRLDSIAENEEEIENVRGEPCYLIKNVSNGKPSTYQLIRIDQLAEEKSTLTLGDILQG